MLSLMLAFILFVCLCSMYQIILLNSTKAIGCSVQHERFILILGAEICQSFLFLFLGCIE